MEQTLTLKLNDEQLENFENLVMEAINNLPDDEEELIAADPNSYAGTLRDIVKAMSVQTNRGSAIGHYMNCEV
tara:strand:- start:1957 stop:2175 length:219 start_codon:yes stop_codon:yes gene_type:complete